MNFIKFFTVLGLFSILNGCANQAERNVQQRAEQQRSVETPSQAASSGRFRIQQSTNLTDAQKIKLLNLMNATELKVSSIKADEGKLKASLFQTISEGKYNEEEVQIYKSKLTKLEKEKMDIMFDNLKKVHDILGKEHDINLDLEMMNIFRS